jgi:hypothetical protein
MVTWKEKGGCCFADTGRVFDVVYSARVFIFSFCKIEGPLWKAPAQVLKNFIFLPLTKAVEGKRLLSESIKNIKTEENKESNNNPICSKCEECYAYTSNNHEVVGISTEINTFHRSKVCVLDDSRVCAEHAVRTRLEVVGEHDLSAFLDFCHLTFGDEFETYDLQDCFASLNNNNNNNNNNNSNNNIKKKSTTKFLTKGENTPTRRDLPEGKSTPARAVII